MLPLAPWVFIPLSVISFQSLRLTYFQGQKQTNYEKGSYLLTGVQ